MPALSLDNTLGAVFLGGIAASILFGVTCVQTYVYYQRSYNDSWLLQCSVGILWILDALDLAFGIHGLYYYMVTNYANPIALLGPTWSIISCIVVTCIIYAIVSAVYAWRIWIVSKGKWYLVVPPLLLCSLSSAFGFAIAARSFQLKFFVQINSLAWMLYTTFSTAVAGDLSIVLALCYFLHKSRTGVRRTESLINRVMLYTVNTGLITCLSHFSNLITYATMNSNFIYIGIYMVTPKLYCNALLATLNARERLLRRDDYSLPLENVTSKSSTLDRFTEHKQPSRTSRLLSALSIGKLPSPINVDMNAAASATTTTANSVQERYIRGMSLERIETNASHGGVSYAKAL